MATCNPEESIDLIIGLYKGKKIILKKGVLEGEESQPNISTFSDTVEVQINENL